MNENHPVNERPATVADHSWKAVVERYATVVCAVVRAYGLEPADAKVVSQMAVGVDNIDVAACAARGIPVGNTPGVLTETTADLAWALLMAAGRRVAEGDRYVRAARWKTWGPLLLLGPDVHGATIGIVGFGRIGRAVGDLALAFGMKVLAHSRTVPPQPPAHVRFVDLESLFRLSDTISLHCPLTPETKHLVNAERLAWIKPTAFLLNTSRGPLIDEHALAKALSSGQIAGAGLDVLAEEPPSADNPLLRAKNCG